MNKDYLPLDPESAAAAEAMQLSLANRDIDFFGFDVKDPENTFGFFVAYEVYNLSPLKCSVDFGNGVETINLSVQTDPESGKSIYVLEESEEALSPEALKMASTLIDFSLKV